MTVWVVLMPERVDGVYVFAEAEDAERFAGAAGDPGTSPAVISEEPVADAAATDELVEAEVGEEM